MNPPAKDTATNRKTIRVVLAEDQGMVLGALAALLEIEGDISVVAKTGNGKDALEAVLANKPDVFITDIEMPHMDRFLFGKSYCGPAASIETPLWVHFS